MIDGGPPGKLKQIQKFLEANSLPAGEIKLMILTHGDFDHIGSAKDIKELTGGMIAIHKNDKINLEKSVYNFPLGVTRWGRISRLLLNPIMKKFAKIPPIDADIILNDEDYSLKIFGINGKIIYTPGHTRGSVSVLLETGEAFVGCLAHNNLPFRLRPGLPIYGGDVERIKESWRMMIDKGAKMIYPGHGNPFPVGVIKKILIADKK